MLQPGIFRGLRAALGLGVLLLGIWGTATAADSQPPPTRAALQKVAETHYDADTLEKGRTFRTRGYVLFFIRLVLVLTVAWWLASGPLWSMNDAARHLAGGRTWLARAFVITALFWGFTVLRLPFVILGYLNARSFGLRHDPIPSFLLDLGKGLAIQWALLLVVGLLVLGLFSRFPRTWWAMAWAGIAALVVGYVMIAPVVIDPLFNRFTRLGDGDMEAELLAIARDGGVPAREVLVADASRRTKAANAYFTGLGDTRRIVLYDTLVEDFPREEVALVVAHEVGHWRHRHVQKGIALGLGALLLGLLVAHVVLGRWVDGEWGGIASRGDPALAVPAYALALTLMTIAIVPSNWVSRRMETEADRASLQLTGDPATFVNAEVRLGSRNLSHVVPPAWIEFTLYTHPSNARRIWMAETWK